MVGVLEAVVAQVEVMGRVERHRAHVATGRRRVPLPEAGVDDRQAGATPGQLGRTPGGDPDGIGTLAAVGTGAGGGSERRRRWALGTARSAGATEAHRPARSPDRSPPGPATRAAPEASSRPQAGISSTPPAGAGSDGRPRSAPPRPAPPRPGPARRPASRRLRIVEERRDVGRCDRRRRRARRRTRRRQRHHERRRPDNAHEPLHQGFPLLSDPTRSSPQDRPAPPSMRRLTTGLSAHRPAATRRTSPHGADDEPRPPGSPVAGQPPPAGPATRVGAARRRRRSW